MKTPPSYTDRRVSEVLEYPQPVNYKHENVCRPDNTKDGQKAYREPATGEECRKANYIVNRAYAGLRGVFRYSRRRPRKLSGQKSNCSYCGGAPSDKPVFATATVAGRTGGIKKNIAPHCGNCGVAVA